MSPSVGSRRRRWAKRLLAQDGFVRWGSLRRTRPVSSYWGLERGTPVDRVYIARFLTRYAGDIRGRVLEVRDPGYVTAYGGERVTAIDIVDIDPANDGATIVADLAEPRSLPAGRFDCAIVTQTLQFVSSPAAAMANVWQALVPGGVALLSAPCASRIDPDWPHLDRWRFTPLGLATLIRDSGDWSEVEVRGFGNVLTSVAFLMGLSGEELRPRELEYDDETFPLVACARARKAR